MVLLLKNLLFTVIVPGTVAVYVPLLVLRDRPFASTIESAIAVAAFAIGGCIYAWCLWDFASFGKGTPAPIDAPKRLVVRGLYRYTRNPMYVGVLSVILGWAVLFRAAEMFLYLVVVGVCFHAFVVLYEERHLRREFGSEYEDYCSRVGRWSILQLTPRHALPDNGPVIMSTFEPHTATFRGQMLVTGEAAVVFPLFSPAGEESWVPGWAPEYLYPAETRWAEGQVFRTQEPMGEAIWVVTRLDREQHRVEYHRVEPGRYVARIAVGCRPLPDKRTEVSTAYSFIGLSEAGNREIAAMTQQEYDAKMSRWTEWTARHLAARRPDV